MTYDRNDGLDFYDNTFCQDYRIAQNVVKLFLNFNAHNSAPYWDKELYLVGNDSAESQLSEEWSNIAENLFSKKLRQKKPTNFLYFKMSL